MATARTGVSLLERVSEKVTQEPTSGCWLWTGAIGRPGYGNLTFEGRVLAAHRASWLAHRGPIPKGMQANHRCDNRACVNPAHLYLGDQKQNSADMMRRGRHRPSMVRGSKQGASKLSEWDIPPIVALSRVLSLRKIGHYFGVDQSMVGRIAQGLAWAHVNRPGSPP